MWGDAWGNSLVALDLGASTGDFKTSHPFFEDPPLSPPRPPSFDAVAAAAERLRGRVVPTPLLTSPILDERIGARVLIKAETLQRTGSFKFRGAYNRIARLDPSSWPGGVVACSSGNHAQGVAEAARLCGLKATIVMPRDAPQLKVARTRRAGAEVVFYDRLTQDREAIANRLAEERRAAFVAPYDDVDVIAGQGTVGLEIVHQARELGAEVDVLLAPCSGGGLMAGIALAFEYLRPSTRLYAVEPQGFDDLARSLASGTRERNAALAGSICDALLVPTPGAVTFEVLRRRLSGALAVSDLQARAAMRFAFEELKLVTEPSGAVALAALLAGKLDVAGRTVAVVLSGANVDAALFAAMVIGEGS